MVRYFAYGAMMNPTSIKLRGIHPTSTCPAKLKDYRMIFFGKMDMLRLSKRRINLRMESYMRFQKKSCPSWMRSKYFMTGSRKLWNCTMGKRLTMYLFQDFTHKNGGRGGPRRRQRLLHRRGGREPARAVYSMRYTV